MTTTSAIGNVASLAAPAKATSANAALDQTAFLKLMSAQLKSQDPFAPVDNTQMVAQMAQFSSTTGIAEMNASLKTIAGDIASSRVGDAASWIGKSALVASETATPLSDGSYGGEIDLPADASSLTLSLVDASGKVVHAQDYGAQAAGTLAFKWDGTGAGGPLTMRVTATGADGAIKAATASWAAIGGVQSPAGGAQTRLITPLGMIAPEAALKLG